MVSRRDAWEETLRLAKAAYPRRFRTIDVHAFTPREHIGDGWFRVDVSPAPSYFDVGTILARNAHMPALHESLGLKAPPFPTALGVHHSNFGFYVWRKDGAFCFHSFHSAYAAKWFVDTMIDGDEYKWLDQRTIITTGGTKIRGEQAKDLETIVEYEYKGKEDQWMPPQPYLTMFKRFADASYTPEHADPDKPAPAPARPKQPATPRAPKPDGLVPLADIAEALNIEPREARQILRKSDVEKPEHGWAWPADMVDKIKKLLRG